MLLSEKLYLTHLVSKCRRIYASHMNLSEATAVTFNWPAGTVSSASIKICIIDRSAKAFPRSSASE